MGAGTSNSFSLSICSPRRPSPASAERTPSAPAPALSGRVPLVDRPRAIPEEPGAPSPLHGHDLGDDGGGDLLRALGAEVEPGGAPEPRTVGFRDVDTLVAELGQQA